MTRNFFCWPQKSSRTAQKKQAGFTMMEILVVVFIVAIMAGAISLTVNVNSTHRQLDKSFHRLNILLDYVQDQAVFRGRYMGLEFFSNGYRFLEIKEEDFDFLNSGLPEEHQEGFVESTELGFQSSTDTNVMFENKDEEPVDKLLSWMPVDQDRKLAAHSLPEGFSFILEIDDVILSMDELPSNNLENTPNAKEKKKKGNDVSKTPSFKPQIIITQEGMVTPFKLILAHEADDIERNLELNTVGEVVEADDE